MGWVLCRFCSVVVVLKCIVSGVENMVVLRFCVMWSVVLSVIVFLLFFRLLSVVLLMLRVCVVVFRLMFVLVCVVCIVWLKVLVLWIKGLGNGFVFILCIIFFGLVELYEVL